MRIATMLDIWTELRWFFPYFDDLGIQWDDQLAPALESAARAATADAMQSAVWTLLTRLHDGHAFAVRFNFDAGCCRSSSAACRTSSLWSAGSPPTTRSSHRHKVLSVNGLETPQAIARAVSQIPGATPGWIDYSCRPFSATGRVTSSSS